MSLRGNVVTPDRVTLARLATAVADQAATRHQWALTGGRPR